MIRLALCSAPLGPFGPFAVTWRNTRVQEYKGTYWTLTLYLIHRSSPPIFPAVLHLSQQHSLQSLWKIEEMPSSSSPSQPQAPSAHEPNVQQFLERRLSQSATSEDSQTVMIDTPSSFGTSAHQPSHEEAPGTPQAQPSSSQEPRKCWICFSDETEDTANSSEWISPCPCALQAHQTCLLDWIADLESPKRKKAKKIQCPQCKSDIRVLQPHSFSIELTRAIQRVTGKLVWPAAATAVGTMVSAGLFIHGAHTVSVLLGRYEYQQFMFPRNGPLPLRRALGVTLIPILLIISRTSVGDSILPFLPFLYFTGSKMSQRSLAMPGRPDLWICSLPALRSFYFAIYRKWALPREKAWLKEIQPRAGDNTEENGAQGNVEEEGGGDGEAFDLDLELGVQIEVDAIDEDGIGHHHHLHHHHHVQDHDLPQAQEAVNPAPADANNDRNGNPNQAQPQQAPRPQARPQRQGRPIIQNFVFAIPDLVRLSLGALALPFVSYYMGQILKATLPKTWIAPPNYWNRGSQGIMQSQTGRTVVGGCLFIVLKDSLFLYSTYSMAQNHKKRQVLNYNAIQKPWYRKNIDELMTRR